MDPAQLVAAALRRALGMAGPQVLLDTARLRALLTDDLGGQGEACRPQVDALIATVSELGESLARSWPAVQGTTSVWVQSQVAVHPAVAAATAEVINAAAENRPLAGSSTPWRQPDRRSSGPGPVWSTVPVQGPPPPNRSTVPVQGPPPPNKAKLILAAILGVLLLLLLLVGVGAAVVRAVGDTGGGAPSTPDTTPSTPDTTPDTTPSTPDTTPDTTPSTPDTTPPEPPPTAEERAQDTIAATVEFNRNNCDTVQPQEITERFVAADAAWHCDDLNLSGTAIVTVDCVHYPQYALLEAFYEKLVNDFEATPQDWTYDSDPNTVVGNFAEFESEGGTNLVWSYNEENVICWADSESASVADLNAWWEAGTYSE